MRWKNTFPFSGADHSLRRPEPVPLRQLRPEAGAAEDAGVGQVQAGRQREGEVLLLPHHLRQLGTAWLLADLYTKHFSIKLAFCN
jgi:hypothetical protein